MELSRFFLAFRRRSVRRWLFDNTAAKLLTAALFLGLLVALAYGLELFCAASFAYLIRNPAVAATASAYVYELFFLVVGLLVVASTLIGSLFTLFRSHNQGLIIASPAASRLFGINQMTVTTSSAWPFLLFFGPAVVALRSAFGLPFWDLLEMLAGIILLSLWLSWLSLALLLGLAQSLAAFKRLTFNALSTGIGLIGLIGIVGLGYWSSSGNLFDLGGLPFIQGQAANVGLITQRFSLLPTHPAARLLYALQSGNDPFVWLAVLAAGAACSYLLMQVLATGYVSLWVRLQEGQLISKANASRAAKSQDFLLSQSRTPLAAVFAKEFLIFRREPQQLLWFGFLIGMWAVQTLLVSGTIRHQSLGANSPLILLVQPLQFLVTLYFVATACLRFVFPSFSSERRSAWLIASSPLSLNSLLLAKSAWFSLLFVITGLAISAINLSLLGIAAGTGTYVSILLTVAILTLVQLSLALGIFFPNFETDDPQVLSTSLPGFFLIGLSLGYGALGSLALSQYLHGTPLASLIWLIGSFASCVVLYAASSRRMRGFEFVKIVK